jgi:hypothetical protein
MIKRKKQIEMKRKFRKKQFLGINEILREIYQFGSKVYVGSAMKELDKNTNIEEM